MRSQLIFQAQERITNRYKLCHAVARVTRRLHFSSSNTEDAISDAFLRVAHVACVAEDVPVAPVLPSAHKQVEDEVYFEHARLELWCAPPMPALAAREMNV
jgi:hypothetical protein